MTREDQIETLTHYIDLKSLAYQFFYIIDIKQDIDSIMACLTDDVELDYRELGAGLYCGHAQIEPFFAQIFAGSKWQVHLVTNFHVTELSRDAAEAKACLFGKGCRQDTDPYEAYAACEFAFKRTATGWKIHRLREYPVVPLSLPWAPEPEKQAEA